MATINVDTGGLAYWVFIIGFSVVMSVGGVLAIGYCIHYTYQAYCRHRINPTETPTPETTNPETTNPETNERTTSYTHNPMMV